MNKYITREDKKPIDLLKYMGAWNVIANIPTFYEKNAFNSVEGYRLRTDGSIFNFFDSNRGSFDGPLKRITAKAWVVDKKTNMDWRVRFFWPVSFAYRILECATDYSYTVVGHPSKRYVWIMSRQKTMDEALLNEIISRLDERGYKISKIKKVPQKPSGLRLAS